MLTTDAFGKAPLNLKSRWTKRLLKLQTPPPTPEQYVLNINRFDKVRIPRENMLNAVADVTPDGQYLSSIKVPDQVQCIQYLEMACIRAISFSKV